MADEAGRIVARLDLDTGPARTELRNFLQSMRMRHMYAASAGTAVVAPGAGEDAKRELGKADAAIEAHAAKVRKATAAVKDYNDAATKAWRAARPGGIEPGMTVHIAEGPKAGAVDQEARRQQLVELRRYRSMGLRGYNAQEFFANLQDAEAKQAEDLRKWAAAGRRAASGMATVVPGALHVGGTTAPAPQPPSAQPKINVAQMAGTAAQVAAAASAAGVPGASTARTVAAALAKNTPLAVATAAITAAVAAFIAALNSASKAAATYARALQQGGLPTRFVQGRESLARVLGVGEQEVLRYGVAVNAVSARLKSAIQVQSDNNAVLTMNAWHWRIMKENFRALGSVISADLTPAVRTLTDSMSTLSKAASFALNPRGLAAGLGQMVGGPIGQVLGLALSGLVKGAPEPGSFAKRLPTSNWERMGLIVGPSMRSNFEQQTAQNTRQTSQKLDKIHAALTGIGAGLKAGAAVSGLQWAMP